MSTVAPSDNNIYSRVDIEGFKSGMMSSFIKHPVMEKLTVNQKRCLARTGMYFTPAIANLRQLEFLMTRILYR